MALRSAFHPHLLRHLSPTSHPPRAAPARRWFASYSRMLDMGGAPSSLNDKNATRINASKNCKLQAVCFDFEVLTKYTPKEELPPQQQTAVPTGNSTVKLERDVKPDLSRVQQLANLVNVDISDLTSSLSKKKKEGPDDDLSLLAKEETLKPNTPFADIRAKYGNKLAKRGVQGGIAQVELAKYQVEETLKRGDAGGHLAARNIAMANPVSRQKSWLALTGTGALLKYLTQRCIQIALLPRPVETLNQDEGEKMDDFQQQLMDVNFAHLVKDGRPGAATLVQTVLQKLELDPTVVLFVSDRDDYLKAAREANLMTCRISPPNARRGNISANFIVPDIPAVQDVVNEINGISFTAISKLR